MQLGTSYQRTVSNHAYPPPVARLLGEFEAAVALLCETLKFDGLLSLQARSNGEIPLIMAEANSRRELRAIARQADAASSEAFQQLLGGGQLSITVEPEQGERYQGIVSLTGSNLARCIETYFNQSEQLATRLWLFSDGERAGGLLLQQLPLSKGSDRERQREEWAHLVHLTETVTAGEALSLSHDDILRRLYHQENVRVFEAVPVTFRCSCSRERTLSALRVLGRQAALEVIEEMGSIDIHCEFCHQHYHFGHTDIAEAFTPTIH